MDLTIVKTPPESLYEENLVLAVYADERPPKGYSGLVDWRLNGLLSTEIARGRISAVFGEKVILPHPERIAVKRLILFGLGPISEATQGRLYEAGCRIVETMSDLLSRSFAVNIPTAAKPRLSVQEAAEAMLWGYLETGSADGKAFEGLRICVQDNHEGETAAAFERMKTLREKLLTAPPAAPGGPAEAVT
ncbi:MAG: hypothetical protein A4E73_03926 [Syntrophaceae bacterium PtaU1.Bin231]|nr:MAG: hypothetical protein A4E73_03926 [Syntrophaceae bacterium PtaU1.Bin231]